MKGPPRYRLTDAEKDALLIERRAVQIAEREAPVGQSQKTSPNSHIPPSYTKS